MMPLAHAKLSPSSSSRWLKCPASIRLSQGIEQKTNSSAVRGTTIHQLGEDLLNGHTHENSDGCCIAVDGMDKSQLVDSDMFNEAKNYYNYVKRLTNRSDDSNLIVEMKVDLTDISENQFGHADAVVLENGTLHIVDLKTGAMLVNANDNSQLKLYAYGAYVELEMYYNINNIVLHIVQNNMLVGGDKSSSWEISPDDLCEWINNIVIPKANEALSDNSECIAGESQCKWCPAITTCKVAMDYANSIIDDLFDDVVITKDTVKDITNNSHLTNLIEFYTKFNFLKNLNVKVEEKLQEELENGNKVEGYKLVNKITRKKWVNDVEAYDKLKTWASLDEIAPRKLVSPTQAEKIIGKVSSRKLNIFKALWTKPEGSTTIAPISDRRVNIEPIASMFN